MKYKVGDEVLVKAKIVEIDVEDKSQTYNLDVKNDTLWVEEDEIVGKEPSFDEMNEAYEKGLNDVIQ